MALQPKHKPGQQGTLGMMASSLVLRLLHYPLHLPDVWYTVVLYLFRQHRNLAVSQSRYIASRSREGKG